MTAPDLAAGRDIQPGPIIRFREKGNGDQPFQLRQLHSVIYISACFKFVRSG